MVGSTISYFVNDKLHFTKNIDIISEKGFAPASMKIPKRTILVSCSKDEIIPLIPEIEYYEVRLFGQTEIRDKYGDIHFFLFYYSFKPTKLMIAEIIKEVHISYMEKFQK